jgi:hypothetical protein
MESVGLVRCSLHKVDTAKRVVNSLAAGIVGFFTPVAKHGVVKEIRGAHMRK